MAFITLYLTASQLIHVGSGLVFTDSKIISLLWVKNCSIAGN